MEFGDVISEAAERAGLDPSALTHRHLASMTRSLMLLQTELETDGDTPEYRVSTDVYTISTGQGAIILPDDTLDVTGVTVDYQSGGVMADISLTRTHRDEYLSLSRKDTPGRPSVYWVSKSLATEIKFLETHIATGVGQGAVGSGLWGGGSGTGSGSGVPTDAKLLVLWPINQVEGARVTVNRMRVHRMPENMMDNVDAARNWLETVCAGLAARTAQKFNYERFGDLESLFQKKLVERRQDEDHHPVYVGFRANGWSRRRRH